MFTRLALSTLALTAPVLATAALADFNEVPLAPESAYYGQDSGGNFTSGGLGFANSYTDFGGGYFGWEGFAVSNRTDSTTAGYGNQFSAYAGGGASALGAAVPGANYAVGYAFGPARITLPADLDRPQSVYLNNTTYAALSMLEGDGFAKKFGGITGDDPDFLELTVTGLSPSLASTGSVTFALADYRFTNNNLDSIVRAWTLLDLTPLGSNVRFLDFTLNGSDAGAYGLNTPTYFAADRLSVVPEPASGAALLGLVSLVLIRRKK